MLRTIEETTEAYRKQARYINPFQYQMGADIVEDFMQGLGPRAKEYLQDVEGRARTSDECFEIAVSAALNIAQMIQLTEGQKQANLQMAVRLAAISALTGTEMGVTYDFEEDGR